jgi:hypothetical protein
LISNLLQNNKLDNNEIVEPIGSVQAVQNVPIVQTVGSEIRPLHSATNLPFPSLRLRSGHAFPKRGSNPTAKNPPFKKGDKGGFQFDFSCCHRFGLFK